MSEEAASAANSPSAAGALPSAGGDSSPLDVAVVTPVPAPPRFCRGCGSTWDPAWTACPHCAPVSPAPFSAVLTADIAADRPRINSALALYFSLLTVSVATYIAGLAGAKEFSLDVGASVAMSLVVLGWSLTVARRPVLFQVRKLVAPYWFVLAAFGGLITFGIAIVIIEAAHRFTGMQKGAYSPVYLDNGYGMWMVVLMVCVQPAIFEELAFRGVVLTSLQPTLSATEAVFVSALMFMVLHLSPAMFPHTLALGLASGFLRVSTGSLLPGMLMHFVHNLMCIVLERTSGM